MKKIVLCLVVLLVVSFGVFHYMEEQKRLAPTDFSDTQMVYEADGAVRRYYASLSDEGKITYTLILEAIRSHPVEIEIPILDSAVFDDVFRALSYDNPDLLCLKNESQIETRGTKAYFIPQYTADAETCEARRAEMLAKADEILSGVRDSMSAYACELYLHDTVCALLRYEHDVESVGFTTYDALVLGKAVCEGYARTMQLLLNRVNIPCYLATGIGVDIGGKSEGHMWNVVTIDGENYYLDATWDDLDAEEIDSFSHAFFNVNEQAIAGTHLEIVPQNNACTATAANYFVVEKLLFSQYNASVRGAIIEELRAAMKTGTNTVEFCFSNDEAFFAARKALIENQEISDLPSRADKNLAQKYSNVLYVQDEFMRTLQFTLQ